MRKVIISKCGDLTLTGTAEQLTRKYESLAYQSEREKDYTLSHAYFQQAEHYKRMNKNGQ